MARRQGGGCSSAFMPSPASASGLAFARGQRHLVAQVQRQRRGRVDALARARRLHAPAAAARRRGLVRRRRAGTPAGSARRGPNAASAEPATPARLAGPGLGQCRQAAQRRRLQHLPVPAVPAVTAGIDLVHARIHGHADLERGASGAACARASSATMSRLSIGSSGRARPRPRPCATAQAVRSPVKAPGPRPKAMASRSASVSRACASKRVHLRQQGRRRRRAAVGQPRERGPPAALQAQRQPLGGGVESQHAGRWQATRSAAVGGRHADSVAVRSSRAMSRARAALCGALICGAAALAPLQAAQRSAARGAGGVAARPRAGQRAARSSCRTSAAAARCCTGSRTSR